MDVGKTLAHCQILAKIGVGGMGEVYRARGVAPQIAALGIACQIALALEAAHEKGIIHRDLKPANIKVIDIAAGEVVPFQIEIQLTQRNQDVVFGRARWTHAGPWQGSRICIPVNRWGSPRTGRASWFRRSSTARPCRWPTC